MVCIGCVTTVRQVGNANLHGGHQTSYNYKVIVSYDRWI
jgi:hypothetical protein